MKQSLSAFCPPVKYDIYMSIKHLIILCNLVEFNATIYGAFTYVKGSRACRWQMTITNTKILLSVHHLLNSNPPVDHFIVAFNVTSGES